MIAAVADPRLDELAAARGDVPRVYAAAAAERARAERQRISPPPRTRRGHGGAAPRRAAADLRPSATARRPGGGRRAGAASTRTGRRLPGPQGERTSVDPPADPPIMLPTRRSPSHQVTRSPGHRSPVTGTSS